MIKAAPELRAIAHRHPPPLLPQDNSELLRALPLAAGALGISSVLINRLASGIEPALMGASSQSRADVVAIFLSAVLCLTGLQWLSLKPKPPVSVELEAAPARYFGDSLSAEAVKDVDAAWAAIQFATAAEMMVVFKGGRCVAHLGAARVGATPGAAGPGPICVETLARGSATFLANLALFPGRAEFYEYLPRNTQSVIVQPVGDDVIVVVGSGTQRAFTILDQAWLSAWNDKLDVALSPE